MIKHKLLPMLAATAILGACGSVGELEPPEGRALPPAPYGTAERASAEQLIDPSVQTRPGRSDELLRRSERREKDPFDLPPGGGAVDAQNEDGTSTADGGEVSPSPE